MKTEPDGCNWKSRERGERHCTGRRGSSAALGLRRAAWEQGPSGNCIWEKAIPFRARAVRGCCQTTSAVEEDDHQLDSGQKSLHSHHGHVLPGKCRETVENLKEGICQGGRPEQTPGIRLNVYFKKN